MATANDQEQQTGHGGSGASAPRTDLHAFAVALRRMNGEINRLVYAFAGDQGLHATDVQALAAMNEELTNEGPGTGMSGPH